MNKSSIHLSKKEITMVVNALDTMVYELTNKDIKWEHYKRLKQRFKTHLDILDGLEAFKSKEYEKTNTRTTNKR